MANTLAFFDAEWGKLILTMIVVCVVLIGGLAAGAYIFVRVLASVLNGRCDAWESSAQHLGLTVNRSAGMMYKPFQGERNGWKLGVSAYSVPRSEHSADDYAAAEAHYRSALPISFAIEKREMFYQKAANWLDMGVPGIGHEVFDGVFGVTASTLDRSSLVTLLAIEMPGGQSPTLLTDLLLAAKRFHRVIVTDRGVTVGVRADFSESEPIDSAIDRATYLAGRIETAFQHTLDKR